MSVYVTGYAKPSTKFCSFDESCDGRLLSAGSEASKDGDVYLLFWSVTYLLYSFLKLVNIQILTPIYIYKSTYLSTWTDYVPISPFY